MESVIEIHEAAPPGMLRGDQPPIWLQAALDALPCGTLAVDATGTIACANARAATLLLASAAPLIGRTLHDRQWTLADADGRPIPPDSHDQHQGVPPTCTLTVPGRQGGDLVLQVDGGEALEALGNLRIVTLTDVTARVRAEQELRRQLDQSHAADERARLLELAVIHARDAVLITRADQQHPDRSPIVYVNDAFLAMTGYTNEEVVGRGPGLLNGSGTQIETLDAAYRSLQQGRGVQVEVLTYRKDGSSYWAECIVTPVAAVDGSATYWISIERDVTERVQARQDAEVVRREAEDLARARLERAQEAEALAQVSLAFAHAAEPSALYQVILEQAARLVPYDHGEVILYQDGWATVAANAGEPCVPPNTRLLPVEGPRRQWMKVEDGLPVYMPDADAEPFWTHVAPWVGERRLRSIISVPLLVHQQLLGTLHLASFTPHSFSGRHLELATAFGERATHALRHAHLHADERARARAAESLAHLRSDFVAAVSHELRTPLTAIVGYAELLQDRWLRLSDEKRLDQIGRIVRAAERQQHLVEDLLLLSQLEEQQLAPEPSASPVRPLVEQAAQETRANFPDQSIQLTGAPDLAAYAAPHRLLQILANLLDNAAKYSPEGSAIAVSWQAEGQVIAIRVKDAGEGISEAGREYLFTKFGRVPGSRIRAGRVGTGLGLYLGKQLARSMGGDLTLEHSTPQGSTFRLHLPRPPN